MQMDRRVELERH